jgi:hypothetical protein
MTTTQLTPAQHAILAYALEHTSGKIDWFPDNIKGGARKKVLDGLFNRPDHHRRHRLVRRRRGLRRDGARPCAHGARPETRLP